MRPVLPVQESLAGFGPSEPTDRLFFALLPDPATSARIAELARGAAARHGLRGTPLEPERLHVTLFHLGDWTGLPPGVVEAANRAATELEAPSFEVRFDQMGSFAGRKDGMPFVLKAAGGNHAMRRFHAELARHLGRHGLAQPVDKSWEPHVTLLYDRQMIAFEPVQPLTWRADGWVLVHSLLGRHRHVKLGHWPLSAAAAG